ncbi:MAG: polysaccharide deacetylase family protein [Melioribacteraceae bacterium]|jgi:peptidoglycan/xylan/chitin deacetylase (PgdA/CDA1 family)
MKWKYNPPSLIKNIFSDFQWESEIPKILITFDDGPNPNTTEFILKELQKDNIKTIFFCVGENLHRYNSLAEQILSEGHEIGNHTFKHQKITNRSVQENNSSIEIVQNYTLEKFNYNIKYFRPPHGRFDFRTKQILNSFQLRNVLWSLLTFDYKNDLNIVKFAIENYLSQNSIIVLHDSNKSKNIILDSINIILEQSVKKNYQIGKPSECLKHFS